MSESIINALAAPRGVDASIPMRVGAGVTPLQNPLDTFGKAASIGQTLAATKNVEQNTAANATAAFRQGFAEFLALPPDLQTQQTARQMTDHFLALRIIGPEQHAASMQVINSAPNAAALRGIAQRGLMSAMGPAGAAATLYGADNLINTGGEQVPVNASTPMGRAVAANNGQPVPQGMRPTGGVMANTMPPGTSTDLVEVPVMAPDENGVPQPTGASEKITRAELARRTGQPGTVAGAGTGSIPGNGRIPPKLLPHGMQGSALPPASNPPPTGGAPVSTGNVPYSTSGSVGRTLTPAEQGAAASRGTAATSRFQEIAQQGVQGQQAAALLNNLLGDASIVSTGPGTEMFKKAARVLQAAGVNITDPDKITSLESMGKILAQVSGAASAGSDARAGIIQSGNPAYDLSPDGFKYVTRQMIGTAKWAQARQQLAAAIPPNQRNDSTQFDARVSKMLNPHAFQLAELPLDQARMYLKGLSRTARVAAMSSYDMLLSQGIIGGQNGGR